MVEKFSMRVELDFAIKNVKALQDKIQKMTDGALGGGGGKGAKPKEDGDKKRNIILSKINLKIAAIIALFVALKPIIDLIKVVIGLILFYIFKLWKFLTSEPIANQVIDITEKEAGFFRETNKTIEGGTEATNDVKDEVVNNTEVTAGLLGFIIDGNKDIKTETKESGTNIFQSIFGLGESIGTWFADLFGKTDNTTLGVSNVDTSIGTLNTDTTSWLEKIKNSIEALDLSVTINNIRDEKLNDPRDTPYRSEGGSYVEGVKRIIAPEFFIN